MNPDLDTLATRLYVTIDDLLIAHPQWAPERPVVGIVPKLTDAELITLAVIQALLGFTSEARFWRHADIHLRSLFPYLPQRPTYNKRLRNDAATMQHIIGALARDCPSWNDDLWLVDSTPVECGRSRETVNRSDMAGYASYGYCASHSRWFWGLWLHLVTTVRAARHLRTHQRHHRRTRPHSQRSNSTLRSAKRSDQMLMAARATALLASRPNSTLGGHPDPTITQEGTRPGQAPWSGVRGVGFDGHLVSLS